MKPDDSSSCSLKPTTFPYPEPDQSRPHLLSSVFRFILILCSQLRLGLLSALFPLRIFLLITSPLRPYLRGQENVNFEKSRPTHEDITVYLLESTFVSLLSVFTVFLFCLLPFFCLFSIVWLSSFDMIWYDMIYFVNCNWVDAKWQQYSTVHIYTQTVHRTTQWNRIHITEHT